MCRKNLNVYSHKSTYLQYHRLFLYRSVEQHLEDLKRYEIMIKIQLTYEQIANTTVLSL